MDFDLSPEHALLRSTIRDFMVKEVAPVVDEHERERRFPVEVVRRLGEMGWLGIPIPEDEGGAGPRHAGLRDRDRGDRPRLGLAGADRRGPHQPGLRPAPPRRHAGAEGALPRPDGLRQGPRRLRPDGARRRQRRRRHADDRRARGRARRRHVGDVGGKRFITNAGQAGTYIITARTGTTPKGDAEITAFIVPADTPGFSVGRLEDKLGLHASATGELLFDGARVPAANLLGERGEGFRTFLKILDGGRISIGALAVGLAQAALDASIPYAQTREQFGRPIGSFQGVAFMVADMATEIEAARQMVWRAAWLKDQGRDYSLAAARGEAVRIRGQLAGDQQRHPDPRRLRLRRGVQGRALHARREADRDRGGDQPDPAARDRPPDPGPARGLIPFRAGVGSALTRGDAPCPRNGLATAIRRDGHA